MFIGSIFALLALTTGYLSRRAAERSKVAQTIFLVLLTIVFGFSSLAHFTHEERPLDPRAQLRIELRSAITAGAKDPDSLKFDYNSWQYSSNGACVRVNGKNSFGAYTGYKTYCLTVDPKTGKREFSGGD